MDGAVVVLAHDLFAGLDPVIDQGDITQGLGRHRGTGKEYRKAQAKGALHPHISG